MMTYVIWVESDEDNGTMYCAPVPDDDAAYLGRVCATLSPLSDEDYLDGLANILQTGVVYSYVLAGEDVLWCVEYEPGLIVVQFSPNGQMAWTAIRSPVPEFAGREPLQADLDTYDEDAPNPQYNLIFNPWDAQLDEEDRDDMGFEVAADEVRETVEAALAHVNQLHSRIEQLQSDPTWGERCEQNLQTWCGEGIRIT